MWSRVRNDVDTGATSSKKYMSTWGGKKIKRVNLDDDGFDDPYANKDVQDEELAFTATKYLVTLGQKNIG